MRGNREGQWGHLATHFGPCGRCPQTISPNREVVTFYIFVSFLLVERAKDAKYISGLKPMRKLDLGLPLVSFYHKRRWQLPVEPPPPSLYKDLQQRAWVSLYSGHQDASNDMHVELEVTVTLFQACSERLGIGGGAFPP